MSDCTKDCTVDCGRCKGDPIGTLKRHIMRQLGFSRSAHGGVPFDRKDTWDQGYMEARRAVVRVLYPRPGSDRITTTPAKPAQKATVQSAQHQLSGVGGGDGPSTSDGATTAGAS